MIIQFPLLLQWRTTKSKDIEWWQKGFVKLFRWPWTCIGHELVLAMSLYWLWERCIGDDSKPIREHYTIYNSWQPSPTAQHPTKTPVYRPKGPLSQAFLCQEPRFWCRNTFIEFDIPIIIVNFLKCLKYCSISCFSRHRYLDCRLIVQNSGLPCKRQNGDGVVLSPDLMTSFAGALPRYLSPSYCIACKEEK